MQPRLIRFRDAPTYLGMDRNRFNVEVRPYLIEIPIGKQGIAFDRLDLDTWVDQYKKCNGRPPSREKIWDGDKSQSSSNTRTSVSSTKSISTVEFDEILAKALKTAKERKKLRAY